MALKVNGEGGSPSQRCEPWRDAGLLHQNMIQNICVCHKNSLPLQAKYHF